VTVIHSAPELKLKNFNSLVNSLSPKIITNFEESYFMKANEVLTSAVDKLVSALSEYGAVKLGIRTEENGCFSDPMFLYRRIMQLNEEECLLPITDISVSLASHQYAVGNDMIEVIDGEEKKFAALLSIKEYQEVSSEALDKFLQIPVEMVATEVFYFVDKKEVLPLFEEQSYIADISGDKDMKSLNGLDIILDNPDAPNKFCHQQISIMVIGDDSKQLNSQVKNASDTLAKIGIVHVREDINLEKTFWAQLPGNFAFLARMSPTVLDNTAALASLHNFPTGNQYNPWGRAVTLLRTEKGTPYFMNFHDIENNSNCCILGIEKSGRTTLLNFLLSEADKFKPTIIQIVDDLDSGLYVKARGGLWFQRDKGLINPLYLEDNDQNRAFCFEFFKILAKHHFDPLKEDEIKALQSLSESVFDLPINERKLSSVIGALTDSASDMVLKKRLKDYIKGGLYYELFETDENLTIQSGELIAISLEMFDDIAYRTKNFPKEKKLIEEYEYNLNSMRSVKAAIVYTMQRLLASVDQGPKIFAIDNMAAIINMRCYSGFISEIAQNMKDANGVFISTVNIHVLEDLYQENVTADWLSLIGTKLLLPPEVRIANLDQILNLTSAEVTKLETLNVSSRMFVIKQDGRSISSELSIGGLPGVTRFLSSGIPELELYKKVVSQYSNEKLEDWVGPLYDELANVN
jgi:type IV secretion system protein VirB4